ncbi:MAG: efflux transporter outer membrane subunit [Rubrivivax sp.]|nr:MAG: efflux transporter outer membrane subunit [Rubrivivax sp.]
MTDQRKNRTVVKSAMTLAALLALGACSLTPEYRRPDAPVPAQWPEAPASAASSATSASPSAAELPWASYFPDTRLQGLIRKALDNNRDLRVAVLNIEQVRAQYQVQRADQFPTLNASISGTRQPAVLPPHDVTTTAQGGVTITAFELDLFGRLRALSAAASAQLLSTEEARRATHISLIASVANSYYAVWADRWQLALAEQTLQARQGSMNLQQLKFDNGVLNELDLRSAQSVLEAARISRAQAQRQLAQDINGLNLLVGESVAADLLPVVPIMPSASAMESTDALSALVQNTLWPGLSDLPVGLPSDVLLKRPDIAQAEQQLISANANIGAARANMFPRISLTASAGVVSDSLSGLFDNGRSAWSFSPALTLPIFDFGRNLALVDSARVKRDIAVAQYERAVQGAFREVADALVARSSYADQAQAQQAQTDAEAARLRLATLRYSSGVASQLDLLDAQRGLFASQQALIAAQLARQQSHINLYKALGGGWTADTTGSSAAASVR